MVFDVVGSAVWSSNYNQDGASNNGTRLCPTRAGPSSYYGGTTYDYVSGLADRFHDVVHAVEQPLWNDCAQFYGAITKLDDIDSDYCKFYEEARYEPIRESKKTPYVILSYLSITPCLLRLYASEVIAEQITVRNGDQKAN
ncbi:UNVERIFIED_CONTAM: hypothetical protein Sindi_1770800 [Sesamum indicum]